MTTARDIASVFESIAPRESGIEGDQLGFIHGDPGQVVTGVGCVWSADGASLQRCAEQGLNMVICHEALWLPYYGSKWYDVPGEEEIFSVKLRRRLLDEHQMVVYRSHSNWDALPVDGVPDQAIAAMGIEGIREIARERFFSVQELPRPFAISELRDCLERGLDFSGARVFGDPTRTIRRFAFLIGGFGENQFHMPQVAHRLGAEAIIIGEMSEFIVMAALEMGMPVIETLHSVSEIPAIKRQAVMLGERLSVPVRYVPSGAMGFLTYSSDPR